MNKYPYVVTVYRKPGGTRPVVQQSSFEAVGSALAAAEGHARDRATVRVSLGLILQEWVGPRDDARPRLD
jgi:hypothetical protein